MMVETSHAQGDAMTHRQTGLRSKFQIAGHPIHPMLIPFPIAFLTAVVVTDIVLAAGGSAFWAELSWWLLIGGVVSGAVTALAGLPDFIGHHEVRRHRTAWFHLISNSTVLILAIANLGARVGDRVDAVVPVGIVLSILTAGALMLGGWFGGELAYRHGVGMDLKEGAAAEGQPAGEDAERRSEAA